MSDDTVIVSPPAKYKSAVWKYFGFPKDGNETRTNNTICRLCKHEIRYTCKNTSNMAIHLRRKHGIEVSASATIPISTAESPAKIANPQGGSPQPSTSSAQPTIKNMFKSKLGADSTRAKEITRKITLLLATDMRPFSLVDNKAFKDLIECLEPRYNVPSRVTFSQKHIPSLYHEACNEIKQSLKQANTLAMTEQLVTILNPLKTITTILCDEHQPTISMMMPLLHNLMESLSPCDDDSRFVKSVKQALLTDLNKRYQDPEIRDILWQATILDPRFETLPFLQPDERLHTCASDPHGQ